MGVACVRDSLDGDGVLLDIGRPREREREVACLKRRPSPRGCPFRASMAFNGIFI